MKTTVKASFNTSVTVRPAMFKNGDLILSIERHGVGVEAVSLTQDQCAALIFGIERAIETIELRNAARLPA